MGEGLVARVIGELGLVVGDGFDERGPDVVVVSGAGDFAIDGGETFAEFGIGFFAAGEADDAGAGGQVAIGGEVVECGDELAVGEIAGGTEDNDGARLGARACDEVFAEGVHGVKAEKLKFEKLK